MIDILISMSIVFFVKVFDNILGTLKTIFIQRNKAVLSSIIVIITNIIFYKLIDAVNTGGEYTIYVISIASGLGTYLALIVSNKFSKDRIFVNVIMNDDMEVMTELRKFLKSNKITNLTTDAYTKDFNKTLAITAYAETKSQSKLIDDYIKKQNIKFKRIISKQ